MAIATINPKKFRGTFGPVILSGYADDMVSIEYPDDAFEVVRGGQGEVTMVNKSVDDVQVTVTLKQSSATNDQLSVIHIADRLTGAGVFPLVFIDGSGTTLLFADAARIVKAPTVDFGNSAKDRVWTFHTGPCELHIGGN